MGVGVVEADAGDLALVYSGVLTPKRVDPLSQRLHHLHQELLSVIQDWKPSAVAIEEPFVARNVRAAMALGHSQAIAMLAAASHGLEVSTYSPGEVKKAVTDYGGSSKEQVQEMVRVLLGLSRAPEPFDASDALAVAICHLNASRVQELTLRE